MSKIPRATEMLIAGKPHLVHDDRQLAGHRYLGLAA